MPKAIEPAVWMKLEAKFHVLIRKYYEHGEVPNLKDHNHFLVKAVLYGDLKTFGVLVRLHNCAFLAHEMLAWCLDYLPPDCWGSAGQAHAHVELCAKEKNTR